MTLRELLAELIDEAPSRGLDYVDIYISDDENDMSYRIKNITNKGNNDSIFIELENEYE